MRPRLHVRRGDTVLVLAGKDRGKRGKVIRAIPSEQRVVVEGINRVKKHVRPSKKNPQGGIIEQEAPIHASNVQVVCPSCSQPTRVGHTFQGKEKFRVCKKCGARL